MILFITALAFGSETASLDAYLSQRLDVVNRPVTTVYAPAYDGSGAFWFVERGGGLIDGARFAELTGDDATREALHKRSRRARTGGALALAGGLALTAVSYIGPTVVQPIRGQTAAQGVQLTGMGVGIGAAAIGTWSLGRSVSLRHPSAVYTRDEAVTRAQAHNEALRDQLLGDE